MKVTGPVMKWWQVHQVGGSLPWLELPLAKTTRPQHGEASKVDEQQRMIGIC